jgi:acyl-coenzyme A synthetase/AMP-(fatty) acid ligase
VSPAELEMALLENDNIADAAVVGITMYVRFTQAAQ